MTNPKKILLTLAGAAAAMTALLSFAPAAKAQSGGDYCREYTRTVTIGNRREEAYGTACLQPDGQWQIVNESDLRPVSYDNYVGSNRTVYVQQPTQIVYRDRTPTRVFFFGSPRRHYDYHRPHYRHYYKYDRHDHHRGRGHGHHHGRGRGHDRD